MRPGKASFLLLLALLPSVTGGCTNTKVRVNSGDAAGLAVVGVVGLILASAAPVPERVLSPCEKALSTWRRAHPDAGEMPPAHLRCAPGGQWPAGAERVVSAEVYTGGDPAAAMPVVAEGDPGLETEVLTSICGGTDTQIERCEQERARRKLLREQRGR